MKRELGQGKETCLCLETQIGLESLGCQERQESQDPEEDQETRESAAMRERKGAKGNGVFKAQKDRRASRANRVQMAPLVFLELWEPRVCEDWKETRVILGHLELGNREFQGNRESLDPGALQEL